MVISIIVGAVSAIVSSVSSIGPAVSSFCASVLPKIIPVIEQAGSVIKVIANCFFGLQGVFLPGEDVENIGDRAIQAAQKGVGPEKFESYNQYMDAIRQFELDPEKSEKLSGAEKIAAGLAVSTVALEKKLDVPDGSLGAIWILAASNPDYFNGDRLSSLIKAGGNVLNAISYFEGKLEPSEAVATRNTLMEAERILSPDKPDTIIYSELSAAKDSLEKFNNQS